MSEDVALQNVQARLRMVFTYMISQLYPTYKKQEGFYIVLGSSNLDESLRGYFTKFDNSSADIAPISGINKFNIREFSAWFAEKNNFEIFKEISGFRLPR